MRASNGLMVFGLVLIGLGLTLALAISDIIDGVDLRQIGWIAVGIGVLSIVGWLFQNRSRNTSSSTVEHVDPTTGDRVVDHEGRV